MTIWFVLGTAAELIKMYPVILEAEKRNHSWFALNSGQSPVNLLKQWHDLKLPSQKLIGTVVTDSDLKSSSSALKWFFRAVFWTARRLKKTILSTANKYPTSGDVVFVHGDTLTTLVGAIWSKKLRIQLAHVEAGLRSGKLTEPFPEEICRKVVSFFARFHFAPDDKAVQNLKNEHARGLVISTQANTLLDAVRIVSENFNPPVESMKNKVLVNLHRYENLNNQERWEKMISTVHRAAKNYHLVFVSHPPTVFKLSNSGNTKNDLIQAGVEFKDRVPFSQFVHWLKQCDFLITDGGSNQEEASYLGKPCLLLREKTERQEGLGVNCVLSQFEETTINAFLDNPEKYRTHAFPGSLSPSKIILDSIEKSKDAHV